MIEKNIFIVHFGDKPKYVDFCVNIFKQINPNFNVQLIHYTMDEIEQLSKQSVYAKKIKYEFDYLLHYIINYTKQNNNYSINELLKNYRYCIINEYGGICVKSNCLPIRPFDDKILSYENFSCDTKNAVKSNINSDILIGCQKNKISSHCTKLNSVFCSNYMPIQQNKLFYECDKKVLNFKLNDCNIDYIDIYDPTKLIIQNTHKYCVFYSLFDIDNHITKEYDLYYYKGILQTLMIEDRNFDIHIDITQTCYDILIKLCNINNISLTDVFFNIRQQPKYSEALLWRIQSAINSYDKYETVYISDTDLPIHNNLFDVDVGDTSIYYLTHQKDGKYYFCWQNVYIPGGMTYFKFKNFKTDIEKLKYIMNELVNSNLIITYGFDEELLNHLLHTEIICNKYKFICLDDKCDEYLSDSVIYINNQNIKMYNDIQYIQKQGIYYIDDIPYKINNKKPSNNCLFTQIDKYTQSIYKYMFLQIEKYICGNIDVFDINKYTPKS